MTNLSTNFESNTHHSDSFTNGRQLWKIILIPSNYASQNRLICLHYELIIGPRCHWTVRQNIYLIYDISRYRGVKMETVVPRWSTSQSVPHWRAFPKNLITVVVVCVTSRWVLAGTVYEIWVPMSVEMAPRVSVKSRCARYTNLFNLICIGMGSEGVPSIDLPVGCVNSLWE